MGIERPLGNSEEWSTTGVLYKGTGGFCFNERFGFGVGVAKENYGYIRDMRNARDLFAEFMFYFKLSPFKGYVGAIAGKRHLVKEKYFPLFPEPEIETCFFISPKFGQVVYFKSIQGLELHFSESISNYFYEERMHALLFEIGLQYNF